MEPYKVRLIALEYLQKERIDCIMTFARAAKMILICIFLALVAINDAKIHQMDVKTEFLNSNLKEKIYMNQPKGFAFKSN